MEFERRGMGKEKKMASGMALWTSPWCWRAAMSPVAEE